MQAGGSHVFGEVLGDGVRSGDSDHVDMPERLGVFGRPVVELRGEEGLGRDRVELHRHLPHTHTPHHANERERRGQARETAEEEREASTESLIIHTTEKDVCPLILSFCIV